MEGHRPDEAAVRDALKDESAEVEEASAEDAVTDEDAGAIRADLDPMAVGEWFTWGFERGLLQLLVWRE